MKQEVLGKHSRWSLDTGFLASLKVKLNHKQDQNGCK